MIQAAPPGRVNRGCLRFRTVSAHGETGIRQRARARFYSKMLATCGCRSIFVKPISGSELEKPPEDAMATHCRIAVVPQYSGGDLQFSSRENQAESNIAVDKKGQRVMSSRMKRSFIHSFRTRLVAHAGCPMADASSPARISISGRRQYKVR